MAFLVIIIDFKHEVGPVYSDNLLDEEESTEQLSQILSGNCVLVMSHPWTKADSLALTIRINSRDLVMRRNYYFLAFGGSIFSFASLVDAPKASMCVGFTG